MAALDDSERYAFDYFMRETAAGIQLLSPDKGWVQLALQLSSQAAPVIYAITALGCVHRAQVTITHTSLAQPWAPVKRETSVRQYNKAISSLQKYIDRAVAKDAPVEPVLLASLLFVCFEVMQNKGEAALSHLQSGRQIVREHTVFTSCRKSAQARMLSFRSREVTDQLVSTFDKLEQTFVGRDRQTRLDTLCRDARHYPLPGRIDLHRPFTSVTEARTHLNDLMNAGEQVRAELLRIAEAHVSAAYSGALDFATRYCLAHCLTRVVSLKCHPQLESRMEKLTEDHAAWQMAFAEFQSTHTQARSPSSMLLQIQHFFSHFVLSTCRQTEERLADRFSDEYARVLSVAEQYLREVVDLPEINTEIQTPFGHERQGTFSLELSILPAINMICYKCRDPSVRRRAISLLRCANRREVLFSSWGMAAHADAVERLEELRLQDVRQLVGRTDVGLDDDLVFSEAARFSDVVLAPDSAGRPEALRIICGRFAHERGQELELTEHSGYGYPIHLEWTSRLTLPYASA
ncbi:hypothetical protein LTR36_004450 [Oleoguttula mirabilis]|uniref:Uncharacterized protein n=1 Tax=Oleoguttula mirabilis TaxID=1507867 RepID=A0AAV9JGF6_9PEZI|nr:hypothetical protein LTR36_004450 [Oleoguttula mirabilis]